MATPTLQSITKSLAAHPRKVVVIVMGLILLWFGWNAYRLMSDRVLSESDVISRQVRVQQQALDTFSTNLQAYRQPAPPANGIASRLFTPQPSQP